MVLPESETADGPRGVKQRAIGRSPQDGRDL